LLLRKANDASSQTVTGCLQKGTENYKGFYLISSEGKHWELYPNSDVSLDDNVGKTVAVTGTVASRTEAQEKKSQTFEKKEMGSRDHADLKVSGVRVVSDTCNK
jgi:hypothetical protein